MRLLQALAYASAISTAGFLASSAAYGQSAFGDPLFAVLVGGNECTSAAVCRKGDLDAIGSVTLIFPTTTSVCWAITVDNLSGATAAHIHRGAAGVVGGVVVTLTPPSAPGAGNPGASSGCQAGILAGTISAIKADPTSFYVNVHNSSFPDGAARGQLH
jgi:hypothetical protein